MRYFLALITISIILSSCNNKAVFVRNVEAIDDISAYEAAAAEQASFTNKITASVETNPVQSQTLVGDSADDPAIWYNEANPDQSVIFGTNKVEGLYAYNLDGEQLQRIPYAKINNIDIRQNVRFGNQKLDLLAGSNRTNNAIDLFIISKEGSIAESPNFRLALGKLQPYGYGLFMPNDSTLYSLLNDKYGNVVQHHITMQGDSLVGKMVRRFQLPTQAEGIMADDKRGIIYIGEEQTGIHSFKGDPNGGKETSILEESTIKNKNIRFDIEGIAYLPPHYMLASSQGNFTYAIFDLKSENYLTSFSIKDGETIDGVEETDGLEILRKPLGSKYPEGILVVQDGFNRDKGEIRNQNFKIIDLRQVLKLLPLD